MRIALAQINPTVGDLWGNAELIARYIDKARGFGADVVTFPEMALCGYPPEDLLLKPRFLRDNREVLLELAPASEGICAIVGLCYHEEGRAYNAAAVLHQGRLGPVYGKMELPNYEVFDEKRYFHPGRGCLFLEAAGYRILVTICEDIWIEDSAPMSCAASYGVDLTINGSASPFHAGKLDERRQIVSRFARATGGAVAYNNMVGGQDELVFDGGSLVVSADGEVLASAERFSQDLLLFDLDTPARRPKAEPPEPHALLGIESARGPRPRLTVARRTPELDPVEEVYLALVMGTGDYIRKNGFKKVVLGLSGGIDSSLTAAVAVEALGAENVMGVTMPSRYTSESTRGDAERLAANLGIELITVPIEETLAAYLGALGPSLGPGDPGVTGENLQARIRGNILMALSNHFGWLVLTTGNKSETAVGYCTLYGDMAGGFAVIKDVPKTLVYELSRFVNRRAGRELIPHSVLVRPPSAELRPDQKDEDSLPPYEVLDPILKAYVEQDKVLDEIVAEGHDPKIVKEVVALVDINEYKRRQAPPGVKITPKAFGKDRRLPITNRYRPGWG